MMHHTTTYTGVKRGYDRVDTRYEIRVRSIRQPGTPRAHACESESESIHQAARFEHHTPPSFYRPINPSRITDVGGAASHVYRACAVLTTLITQDKTTAPSTASWRTPRGAVVAGRAGGV